jgi:hypothetical protein
VCGREKKAEPLLRVGFGVRGILRLFSHSSYLPAWGSPASRAWGILVPQQQHDLTNTAGIHLEEIQGSAQKGGEGASPGEKTKPWPSSC